MKNVLIISPFFPPSNAADMQRVRMSLPYFRDFGWNAEVVTVDQKYAEVLKDHLLLQSVPDYIKVYYVKAFSKKITSKFGLGSIALRSLFHYRNKVNKLLKHQKFDLIYFSTTMFPVCILGAYWKKKFGIPYIIDMQDPWHSEYYKDNPKTERPSKYWFSYRLNKYLEPIAMRQVDGLISVSEKYITTLKNRYSKIQNIPQATITFGAYAPDLEIAADNRQCFKPLLNQQFKNIVYVGRGGGDMHKALKMLFSTFKQCIEEDRELFSQLRFYFIGTSYAPAGQGKATVIPIAKHYGLEQYVIEITDRISYYHTLWTLQQADALFVPGSDDPGYTASKIYPYILTKKPLLAIFNKQSSVISILEKCTVDATILKISEEDGENKILRELLTRWANSDFENIKVTKELDNYSARAITQQQVELFNKVMDNQPLSTDKKSVVHNLTSV